MIDTTALRLVNKDRFSIVWDTGKFCNYDCTYCEATRHNNYSKHKTFEEYQETFEFIRNWTGTYNQYRKTPARVSINFTGGEPTANPNFWQLLDYIAKTEPDYELTLITNGAWGREYSKKILDVFDSVTISYHAEGPATLKARAVQNMLFLHESNIHFQVNLMLHTDYWDECIDLYKMLKEQGVTVNPRPIGDGNIVRKGWFIDSDGTNRRTSHEYTAEQQAWFFAEVGADAKPKDAAEGNQLGRKCCCNLSMEGKVDGDWQPVKFINTNFENWYCSVDWFFLYIDQDMDEVYHHQTCKALYDKTRGAVGRLSESQRLVDELKLRLSQPEIKPIICPNPRCGCGMCVPKARDEQDFKTIMTDILK